MSIDLIYYLGFLICSTTISKQYLEIQSLYLWFYSLAQLHFKELEISLKIQVGKDIKINNFDIMNYIIMFHLVMKKTCLK